MPVELAVHCIPYAVYPVHRMHSRRALPVQVVPAELLYAPSSSAVNFTQTYPMDYTYNDYNEPLRRRFRAAAHAVLPAPPHRPSAPPSATLDAPSMHPYPPPPSAASAALRRLRRPPPPSLTLRRTLPPLCRCSARARPLCVLCCGDARARSGGGGGAPPRASLACMCAAPTRPSPHA